MVYMIYLYNMRTLHIAARVSDETLQHILTICVKEKRSISYVVNELIKEGLKANTRAETMAELDVIEKLTKNNNRK